MAWKYYIECCARSRLWVECATEQGSATFLSVPCSVSNAGQWGSGGGSATDCTALHSAEAEGLSSASVDDCGLVKLTVTAGGPRPVPGSGELRQPSLSGFLHWCHACVHACSFRDFARSWVFPVLCNKIGINLHFLLGQFTT